MACSRSAGRVRTAVLVLLGLGATLFVAVQPAGAASVTITPIAVIGSPGHADLYGWGMATETDGSVLVGDYWNYRIVRYAKDGTPVMVFQHGEPSAVLISGLAQRGMSSLDARLMFMSRMSTKDRIGSSRSQVATRGRVTWPVVRYGPRSGGLSTSRLPRGNKGGK